MKKLLWTLVAALGVGACGGATARHPVFSTDWQNDHGRSIGELQRRLAKAEAPAGIPIAVGVTASGLVGAPLDGSAVWRSPADVRARPVVTGDVVVAMGRANVLLLDARSGQRLWELAHGGRTLIGAGDDGQVTALTLSTTGGRSALVTVDRSGNKLLELPSRRALGTPAVLGGVVFVPWGNQYVSAIEAATGEEVARLLMRDQVTRAMNLGGQLYFGQRVLLRFDEEVEHAWQGGGHRFKVPERELPGQPRWFESGERFQPAAAAAREKIRLLALPRGEGERLLAATYFRVALGMAGDQAKLRWVRRFERDVLGAAAAQGGFVFCDASGQVTAVDERGRTSASTELKERLQNCVVQAAAYEVEDGEGNTSLTEQLAEVVRLPDTELATAQRLLLEELAQLDDPQATQVLIELVSDATTPHELGARARVLLAGRRTGAEHMLKALERHYDFLSGVLRPPPVGPLAEALAALNERRAAPLLAEHLNDPANPPGDVQRAAKALERLAGPSEAEELKTFFAMYRASADQAEMTDAVLSVGRALLRLGGHEEIRLVRDAARDPLTQPAVKQGLLALFDDGGGSDATPRDRVRQSGASEQAASSD